MGKRSDIKYNQASISQLHRAVKGARAVTLGINRRLNGRIERLTAEINAVERRQARILNQLTGRIDALAKTAKPTMGAWAQGWTHEGHQAAAPAPKPGEDWTPHRGGPAPCTDFTAVDIRLRDGSQHNVVAACTQNWAHTGHQGVYEILAWRFSKPVSDEPYEGWSIESLPYPSATNGTQRASVHGGRLFVEAFHSVPLNVVRRLLDLADG